MNNINNTLRSGELERRRRPITVVDARMGRGKSSAAIRYMNHHKDSKRFLYITPYLDEVGRICECCDFDQPESDRMSKSAELKLHMKMGHNVAATHALFHLMDQEARELARQQNYSLIIDESINVIENLKTCKKDFDMIMENLVTEREGGLLEWSCGEYTGRFYDYKEMADSGSLMRLDNVFLRVLSPEILDVFEDVFMLTYLFEGQYQKAYLDFFGFRYRIIGVEKDGQGYYFSNKPDAPPPIDYRKLIHVVNDRKLNRVGDPGRSLSKSWYERRGYNDPDIQKVRNGLRAFFRRFPDGNNETRMWTCFKRDVDKLTDQRYRRYRYNFLQIGARATNDYRTRTEVAYLANRYADPNVIKFFAAKGVSFDTSSFALSEMLQWIWRSAIRDDKPINLYIPSKRMRDMLLEWMDTQAGGEVHK